MERHHIAVFTLGGAAHIYPVLGLCSELVDRGHRVTFATDDSDAGKLDQSGAERVAFKTPKLLDAATLPYGSSNDPRFWSLFASLFCPWLLQLARRIVFDIEGFYDRNRPDVILYDRFSFAGRILAERFGCAAIQLWPTFAHQGTQIRQDGVCSNPDAMVGFSYLLDSFLSAHGIHGTGNLWHTEDLNIYFVPREFQFDSDTFDDRSCFVGTSLKRPSLVGWRHMSDGNPVILVSESTASANGSKYFNDCIEAFTGSKYQVVMSVSERSSRIGLRQIPSNFQINTTARNVEILPHASLTICQGGMGTTLESIYHGVPVLAVPITPYHAEVAFRTEELGLGRFISEAVITPARIRATVDEMLGDTALHDRLRLAQRSYASSNASKAAANRIEEFLRRKLVESGT